MRVSVIGCGYLGAVHAAAMAALGHDVVGVDIDREKVEALVGGVAPFYEPGLPELLRLGIESGRLRFSTDLTEVAGSTVHFVCVGTPQQESSNAADLTHLKAAFQALAGLVAEGDVVVGKSTVPVGTAARMPPSLARRRPARRSCGTPSSSARARGRRTRSTPTASSTASRRPAGGGDGGARRGVRAVLARTRPAWSPTTRPRSWSRSRRTRSWPPRSRSSTRWPSSARSTGADVTQLADAIGYDDRIGRKFLNAGLGFGGGCLPKDIRAFIARAEELGRRARRCRFLKEVDEINLRRRDADGRAGLEALGGRPFAGARVAVLGAAFKPNSDDVRDSPALDVAAQMARRGAEVVVNDPQAMENARRKAPN